MNLDRKRATANALSQHIVDMFEPTQLLKFGKSGHPGFRLFNVSRDLMSLHWQSKNKKASKTKVDFKDVREIWFGQRTEKFKRNKRPDLSDFSFSLIYEDRRHNNPNESLDLVCKDEQQFQKWTTGLQALVDGTINRSEIQEVANRVKQVGKPVKMKKNTNIKKNEEFQGSNDVYAFGWGEWGQNGLGATELGDVSSPKLIEAMLGKGVIGVASGWSHTTLLLEGGAICQYGNVIGTGFTENFFTPTPNRGIDSNITIKAIACGSFHSVALSQAGNLYTWGAGNNGQLGLGDVQDQKQPTLVQGFGQTSNGLDTFLVQVACAGDSTICLADDYRVFTWGKGAYGQLGHNSLDDVSAPKLVDDLTGIEIKNVSAGGNHMFACTRRDTYTWGWNAAGQLGIGTEEDQHRPHLVDVLRGKQVIEIECGVLHTVALISEGAGTVAFSWGSNNFGQLGQGSLKKMNLPRVLDLSELNVQSIKCGAYHTVCLTEDGTVLSTGCNQHGQLGHGDLDERTEFTPVEFLKGKKARFLACGGEGTAVLTARAWVKDEETKECMACKDPFSLLNRRHHCRNCGGIFCGACSNKKRAILKYGLTEPVRVCDRCYTKLGATSG